MFGRSKRQAVARVRAVPVSEGTIWRTPIGDEYVHLNRYQRLRALLREALDDYTDHQSWRCAPTAHGVCRCGLDDFERRVREELADG